MAIKHAENALQAQVLQPGWLVEYTEKDLPCTGFWGTLRKDKDQLSLSFPGPVNPEKVLLGDYKFCESSVKRILPAVHLGCGYDAWDALGIISVAERADRREHRYHHLGGDSHGLLQFSKNGNKDIIIHYSCNVQNSFQARVAALLHNRFTALEEWLKENGGRSLAKQ